MIEIWKPIIGYEGLYEVSNMGRVKSLTKKVAHRYGFRTVKERILRPRIDGRKHYYSVCLGKGHEFLIHRLVAEAFIPNSGNKPQVNHVDGNKLNNNVNNLEWVTPSENGKHAYMTGLWKPVWKGKRGADSYFAKKVNQYDLEGNFIKTWNSIVDITKELGIQGPGISCCCNKKTKKSHGFVWKFTSEVDYGK